MERIFEPRGFFTIPDGTKLSPFLNASDTLQDDLPWGLLQDVSVAAGRLEPGVYSHVHTFPAVAQITYVTKGRVHVRMKDRGASEPYALVVDAGQAVVTEPGVLFQLGNAGTETAEVLYIVSPPYCFDGEEGKPPRHDDTILVAETWDAVPPEHDDPTAFESVQYEARASRAECRRRLARQQGVESRPLASENVVALREPYDYLAPDGSEIRLLAEGTEGGLAHCRLPAGKASAPVRHRTVEELWYVLDGKGSIWRERDGEPPRTDPVKRGDSLVIPVGVSFQFKADPDHDLELLLATIPRWPGAREAVSV